VHFEETDSQLDVEVFLFQGVDELSVHLLAATARKGSGKNEGIVVAVIMVMTMDAEFDSEYGGS
jgi:hypothetical protein